EREGREPPALRLVANQRVGVGAVDPHLTVLPVRVQVVRRLGGSETRGTANPGGHGIDLPALGRRIETTEHARAVARNPGDTVLIRGEPPRSVEGGTPRLQRVGSGIEASDAIAEQLRPPDAVVGSAVTAVGDGNGET